MASPDLVEEKQGSPAATREARAECSARVDAGESGEVSFRRNSAARNSVAPAVKCYGFGVSG